MPSIEKERQHFATKMAKLRAKNTFPTALLDLLEKVSTKQFEALMQDHVRNDLGKQLPELVSRERHAQGASLVPRASFPIPQEDAAELLLSILADVQAAGSDLAEGAVRVKEALDSEELECAQIFRAYLDEDQDFFNTWAEKTPNSPKLLLFLAQSSLTPFMVASARQIRELSPSNGVWDHGHCPVCGSLPFISRLETREGVRMMLCSFCHSDYRVARLGCVYCGEHDPKKLTYFEVEEEPGFRSDLCDQCKMYIKTVDFRKLDRVSVPVLDDLESLALDVLAQSRGHVRPTLSAFGF